MCFPFDPAFPFPYLATSIKMKQAKENKYRNSIYIKLHTYYLEKNTDLPDVVDLLQIIYDGLIS